MKPAKRESSPEENLIANTILNLMTIIVSFTLAALLYAFFGFRPGTHPMIHVTFGLLIAMGVWHIQTFIRTRQIKKQWKQRSPPTETETVLHVTQPAFESASTAKLLDQADFSNTVSASVTENTTKHLAEKAHRSS